MAHLHKLWMITPILFATACGDGGGCGDTLQPLSNPLPNNAFFDGAASVRVSQQGLGFIDSALPKIINTFAGFSCVEVPCPSGEGTCNAENSCVANDPNKSLIGVKVPESLVTEGLALGYDRLRVCDPNEGDNRADFQDCNVYVRVDDLTLAPGAGGTLNVQTQLRAFSTDIPLFLEANEFFIPNIPCTVKINPVNRNLTTVLRFANDNPLGRLAIKPSDLDLSLTEDDVELCGVANIGFIKGLVFDIFADDLNSRLRDTANQTIQGLLSESCELEPCSRPDVSNCQEGVCHFNNNNEVVPRLLGVEGELELSSLLGSFAGDASTIGLSTFANFAQAANGGIDVAAKAGTAGGVSVCVPNIPKPSDAIPAFSPGNAGPSGVAFDAAVGVSSRLLNTIGHQAFIGGALCQTLDSNTISALNSSLFSLLLPSLAELNGGQSASVFLDLVPRTMPRFEIGKNIVGEEPGGNGEPARQVLVEPLINLVLDDLDIDIYVEKAGAFVRIATLQADLVVDFGLVKGANGELVLTGGDATRWLRNLTVLNADLLREDPRELEETIPALLGSLLPNFLPSLAQTFEIPPLNGFSLNISDISGVQTNGQTVDGKQRFHYLGLFARLGFDASGVGQAQTRAPVATHINQFVLDVPTQDELRQGARVTIRAAVDADFVQPNESLLLWHRVDGSMWRPLTKGKELLVVDPVLHIEGKHTIEIAAAVDGIPETLDQTPETIEVTVDTRAPALSLIPDVEDGVVGVLVSAEDSVSAAEDLWLDLVVDPLLVKTGDTDGLDMIDLSDVHMDLDNNGFAFIPFDLSSHELQVSVTDLAGRVTTQKIGNPYPVMRGGENIDAVDAVSTPIGSITSFAGCTVVGGEVGAGDTGKTNTFNLLGLGVLSSLLVLRKARRLRASASQISRISQIKNTNI